MKCPNCGGESRQVALEFEDIIQPMIDKTADLVELIGIEDAFERWRVVARAYKLSNKEAMEVVKDCSVSCPHCDSLLLAAPKPGAGGRLINTANLVRDQLKAQGRYGIRSKLVPL